MKFSAGHTEAESYGLAEVWCLTGWARREGFPRRDRYLAAQPEENVVAALGLRHLKRRNRWPREQSGLNVSCLSVICCLRKARPRIVQPGQAELLVFSAWREPESGC